MTSVCLYFKVHQPYRLKKYQAKDIDAFHCYEDEAADRESINHWRISVTCLPMKSSISRSFSKTENSESAFRSVVLHWNYFNNTGPM